MKHQSIPHITENLQSFKIYRYEWLCVQITYGLHGNIVDISSTSKFSSPCINGLVQERHDSIANTLELHLSCTNPSICSANCNHSHILPWLQWGQLNAHDTQGNHSSPPPNHLSLPVIRPLLWVVISYSSYETELNSIHILSNVNRNSNIVIQENVFESAVLKMAASLSWPQLVNERILWIICVNHYWCLIIKKLVPKLIMIENTDVFMHCSNYRCSAKNDTETVRAFIINRAMINVL